MAESGNALEITLATVMFASNMNSSINLQRPHSLQVTHLHCMQIILYLLLSFIGYTSQPHGKPVEGLMEKVNFG